MCKKAFENSCYGSINEAPDTSGFNYVEFGGSDGRTCPTCKGTGRITKGQEEELVALIPYNDQRLKPSRTKCYVLLAIALSLLLCGLVLFFLLPRAVTIKEGSIVSYRVEFAHDNATIIHVTNQFLLNNSNFFSVQVTNIAVDAFFDQVLVGSGKLKHTLSLTARKTSFPVNITVDLQFDMSKNLDFVKELCTDTKRKVHDLVIKLQATQTSVYLQHSEQDSITAYKYIDCSQNQVKPKHRQLRRLAASRVTS